MCPEILIASTSFDRPTTEPVAKKLVGLGAEVIFYDADSVFHNRNTLMIDNKEGSLHIEYDGKKLAPGFRGSAWYRRPSLVMANQKDKARQIMITEEVKALQNSVWSALPGNSWLNSPSLIKLQEDKLTQLSMAHQHGFNVPKTVVTNSWDSLQELENEGLFVMKMPRGLLYKDDNIQAMYTQKLTKRETEELKDKSPFPGIFQTYINKEREWRVTVVKDEVFEVAIYSEQEAKDDWRKHQATGRVKFKREQLPDDIGDKCASYLAKVGLKYGAFDFIEDHDGNVVFLEMNPNGQYMWLEEELDLPISSAIANSLYSIAKEQSRNA